MPCNNTCSECRWWAFRCENSGVLGKHEPYTNHIIYIQQDKYGDDKQYRCSCTPKYGECRKNPPTIIPDTHTVYSEWGSIPGYPNKIGCETTAATHFPITKGHDFCREFEQRDWLAIPEYNRPRYYRGQTHEDMEKAGQPV